jgi:hypothetical protein
MYTKEKDSPLNLYLDEENPRFRISINPSQNDIRDYMLANEDVLKLAAKIVKMNTVLPGERIIIFNDGNRKIVLEGNRRTCIYQMFLNRALIPEKYRNLFPVPTETYINEIREVDLDVVNSREEAMAYLAARHIEGVKKWSSMSKWRISYEYYIKGMSISEITNHLVLPSNTVKTNICNHKILLRGITNKELTAEELKMLSPLDLKPDKLTRLFKLSDTTRYLKLFYDENYNMKSSIIADEVLENIILDLCKKAFIEDTINTRSTFEDILPIIDTYLSEYKDILSHSSDTAATSDSKKDSTPYKIESTNGENSTVKSANLGNDTGMEKKSDSKSNAISTGNSPFTNTTNEVYKINGGIKNMPYFFSGLLYEHLSASNPLTHGVIRICNEIRLFTNRKVVTDYTLSAAFLTRALIEHSIIYYSKTHKIQGQDKIIWEQVSDNGNPPKLHELIKQYNKSLPNFITDSKMREYFSNLFSNYNETANPLNWIIHRPEEFMPPSSELIQLPGKGLLTLINFLISSK